MARREGRDSDSRRHRSRFDPQPSPKRSRRDDKPTTDRPDRNPNLPSGDHSDRDQKPRLRLQDALPLDSPIPPDTKVEPGVVNKESDKKTNGHHEGMKRSSDPTALPRSGSFFQQHDERGNADRSFSRREFTERGWRDSKYQQGERATKRTAATKDVPQRDEKSRVRGDDSRAWRHDGYFELEADPTPPARKRPSFRETKISADSDNVDKTVTAPVKSSHIDRGERREERGGNNTRRSDRSEKPPVAAGDGDRETQRSDYMSRNRYGAGGTFRGGERFNDRRQGFRPSGGVRVEKWKHDLFDEANRSPTPKNEEDQIAKVEALLLS